MVRFEIRIAGWGGQGIITSGIIMGRAACIHGGMNVVQMDSYGPESRGGASATDVIISDGEIHYVKVSTPDVVITLSQESYSKHATNVGPGCTVILDKDLVTVEEKIEGVTYLPVPATKIAEALGARVAANVVMIGVVSTLTDVLGFEALEKAVEERFPKHKELNIKALEKGREYGERLKVSLKGGSL